jgi:2-polyprenyl-3-methyl-5-hydroxy-6-metoxy-1,4-benzoquinol methylase
MPINAGYSSQQRAEMTEFIPLRRERVLEVGCGEGVFVSALIGVKEAWGIEPSPAADIARQRLHRVFQSTFAEAEAELPLQYFDVIVCNDVIEHMSDHDDFLSRVGRYLAPGGRLVGSVPNVRFYNNLFQMLLEKDWLYTQMGILDRTHLRFFTEKSLVACLRRHNFAVDKLRGLTVNIELGRSWRGVCYYWLAQILVVITCGYFSDIKFLQFAFQASSHQASNP